MKTEKDKMLSGELYNESDPELQRMRAECVTNLARFNSAEFMTDEWHDSLDALLGSRGDRRSGIRGPVTCDYGTNVHLGENVGINYECILMDCGEIHIGDDALIGPRSQLITGLHPLDPDERAAGLESAAPIVIEKKAWLAASVIVLPGITIGEGAVIGAGAVVTKDVPSRVFAAGNPCRVIQEV